MFKLKWCSMPSKLLAMCALAGLVGCHSESNNTMVKSGGAKSKTTVPDSSNSEAPGPQTEPPLTDEPSSTTSEPTVVSADSAARVQAIDRRGLDALITKHIGKVVLVDYWATWCAPCRKKFPHTVALANELQTAGLVVVGVSLDDDDAHDDVVKFLADQKATFPNLRSKAGASDEAFTEFDIPNGSLPCLRLFGRDGQVLKTFAIDPDADKQFTDDDVANAVKAALAKP